MGKLAAKTKFFVYGLLIGLLFAPRKGDETRKEVLGWISGQVQETVHNVTGSTSTGNDSSSS